MLTAPMLAGLGGAAATIGGVFLVRRAWKTQRDSALALVGGWGLLLTSLFLWAVFGGPDRGVAFGIIAVLLCVLAVLGTAMLTAPERSAARGSEERRIKTEAAAPAVSWLHGVRKISVFLLAGPVAGLSALAFTTTIFTLNNTNGAEITGNATAAFFIFPLAWAAFTAVAVIDPKLWRKSLGVIGAGAASAVFLASAG